MLCKGLRTNHWQPVSNELSKIFPEKNLGCLSGPTFAAEVIKGFPSAATLAMNDLEDSQHLAQQLSSTTFRIYSSSDLVGVQVGGAVKNVLAIASGMAKGQFWRKLSGSVNHKGFVRNASFSTALGGYSETLSGLSGLGTFY